MGSAGVGLVIGLGADNTQALAGFEDLSKSVESSAGKSKAALGGVDKSLLSNRESARLLSEELGIHMPRAITGAVSEMLPSIASLGTALLGVFAVKELYEFESQLRTIYRDFDGVTQAEKYLAEAGRENIRLVKELAAKSTEYARREVTSSLHRLQTESAELQIMEDQRAMMESTFGPMGAIFDKLAGETSKYDDAVEKLHADEKNAFDLARTLAKDEEEDRRKAAVGLKQAEKDWAIYWSGRRGGYGFYLDALHAGEAYEEQRAAKIKAAIDGENNALRQSLEIYEDLFSGESRLDAGMKMLLPDMAQFTEVTIEGNAALMTFNKAMSSSTVAAGEQLTAGLAGLIAGRRAQAGIEAIWETAKGIQCLAEGTWPPNPAAIIASALHFEAAAQYAILSGSGGGRRGGGGGGAGSQSSYGRGGAGGGGGGGSSPSNGGTAYRGGGGGGNTVVSIPGNMSAHNQEQMVAWLGIGAGAGIVKINSQGSSGVSVPSY